MIVASSLDLGKSDMLVKLAEDLAGFVCQAVQEGASLDDLERGTFRRVLEMGQSAVKMFLEAQGDGDLGDQVTTPEGTVLYRSDTAMARPVRTIFGEHSFEAYVYSQGSNRKIELRPIDARIQLPASAVFEVWRRVRAKSFRPQSAHPESLGATGFCCTW